MKRRFGEDSGFTLIELLITIVLMGVITVPLGNFMLQYLSTYTQTQNRISDSHDIQIATAYFSQDVADTGLHASASPYPFVQSVWTGPFPANYCGQADGTTILLLRWDAWTVTTQGGQPTGTNSPASVAYVAQGGTLHRLYCTSGTAVSSDATLVHGLQSATPQCSSACDAANPPAGITLALSIAVDSTDSAAPGTVTLSGQRRQS